MKKTPSEISQSEWFSLNQFLHELKQTDSRCVSVYYPYGKGTETISLLQQTQRGKQMEKVESKIQEKILSLKKNPTSVGKFAKTLCIFGWIKNDRVVIRHIGTSKKLPYIYMATKKPYVKPFHDILKANYAVLLVIVDQKTAQIQRLQGSDIVSESRLKLDLQGRHKKGGQSQGRFLRARQTKIHVFFKKIADKARQMDADSDLILLGGPGTAKSEFYDVLDPHLAEKCQKAEGLSFSTRDDDIRKKIITHLYRYRRKNVLKLIAKYESLVKEGLTAKNNSVIEGALQKGAVKTLIVSANYRASAQFKKILKMLESAKNTSAKIEFVTNPAIVAKLEEHGSVIAILRYKIK